PTPRGSGAAPPSKCRGSRSGSACWNGSRRHSAGTPVGCPTSRTTASTTTSRPVAASTSRSSPRTSAASAAGSPTPSFTARPSRSARPFARWASNKATASTDRVKDEISWQNFLAAGAGQDDTHVELEANEPAYILATSGTTAKPKLAVHTHGGYQVYVYSMAKWMFALKESDIWWSTSDIGWVVGHSYIVFGPLLVGGTTIAYEA